MASASSLNSGLNQRQDQEVARKLREMLRGPGQSQDHDTLSSENTEGLDSREQDAQWEMLKRQNRRIDEYYRLMDEREAAN